MNRQVPRVARQTATTGGPSGGRILQRKCICGSHTGGGGGQCAACADKKRTLQRRAVGAQSSADIPAIVHDVLRSAGHSLESASQAFMGSRFGHDFSAVRIHSDAQAAASARAVNALAYTVGRDVLFAAGQYAPSTHEGRHLLAHELTHVLQQGAVDASGGLRPANESSSAEANADAAADAALAGRPVGALQSSGRVIQRRAAPFIKKIKVHLAPPQEAELEWQGTPPADATGSDSFTVSTGKGYGDLDNDPPGTCTRNCCTDPMTQCAPPWNRPDRVGACCTYYGNDFWTGTPLKEHNTWQWWTPIQPWYSSRGIALHQHTEVTGQPIGHGCVRMEEPNAKRIYDYSNGERTNVTIDGRAAPVACEESRRCGTVSGAGGELEAEPGASMLAGREPEAVPGLEGVMT